MYIFYLEVFHANVFNHFNVIFWLRLWGKSSAISEIQSLLPEIGFGLGF
jgi:hypothetical protein